MSRIGSGQMQKVRNGLGRVARAILLIGLLCLVAIATLTMVDVLGRWLFNRPLTGSTDIAEVMLPVVIAASIPAVIAVRGQITIRFAELILPPVAIRTLDSLAALLTLAVLCGAAYFLASYAASLFRASEETLIIGLKLWPTWAMFSALLGLAALIQLLVLIDTIAGNPADNSGNSLHGA